MCLWYFRENCLWGRCCQARIVFPQPSSESFSTHSTWTPPRALQLNDIGHDARRILRGLFPLNASRFDHAGRPNEAISGTFPGVRPASQNSVREIADENRPFSCDTPRKRAGSSSPILTTLASPAARIASAQASHHVRPAPSRARAPRAKQSFGKIERILGRHLVCMPRTGNFFSFLGRSPPLAECEF